MSPDPGVPPAGSGDTVPAVADDRHGLDPPDGERPAPGRSRGSLRRRILVIGVGTTALTAAGLIALGRATIEGREELMAASEDLVQEQRIADRITQAVMRQLALASARTDGDDEEIQRRFREAGGEAYEHIESFLFRDLSVRERVQLELTKTELQQMEVAAARADELRRRGELVESGAARAEMLSHVFNVLDALNGFLEMRAEQLERLRVRQSEAFGMVYVGGGALALLLLCGSLVLAGYVHGSVVRPLGALARATERLGRGHLSVRVPTGHDEEFSAAATGFNRMAANLQSAQERLEDRNRRLLEAMEQVRATQEELIQSEKLSALGRMTAGLAHELNNPLASVLGYGELLESWLEKGGLVPADRVSAEFMAPILQQASRAQHLVRSFLVLARSPEDVRGAARLRDAMDVVANLRAPAFEKAGLRLVLDDLPDRRVAAEEQVLQGILLNLVNNALDAMSPAGSGTLRVSGRDVDGRVEVTFEDEGPGIEFPSRVFEPFYTTKPVGEGTGLGLSLVHRHMEELGGSVRAENYEGGGARFVLDFPEADPEARPGVEEPPPRPAPVRTRDRPPRILVVEDEDHLRHLQKRLLCRIDAEVLLASGAGEARRLLVDHEVDAVISDVKMPGETGLDLYEWVKREHPVLAEHFLFVTGDVRAPDVVYLADRRPEMFVHKPFELHHYLSKVAEVLEPKGWSRGDG